MYVTAAGSNQVMQWLPNGSLNKTFNGFGLTSHMGLAIFGNEIFVAGGGSNNIGVFGLDGTPLREIRHPELVAPQGVAFSSDGVLVTSSFSNHKVLWFQRDGKHLRTVQPAGSSVPRSLTFLPGATLDSTGNPQLGVPFPMSARSPHDPGDVYLTALALGTAPGIGLPDGRLLALNADVLFTLSLGGGSVFGGFAGFLDAQGTAALSLSLPADPLLKGLKFHGALVTLDFSYPTVFAQVSKSVSWMAGQ
jgi:hypothetical protein